MATQTIKREKGSQTAQRSVKTFKDLKKLQATTTKLADLASGIDPIVEAIEKYVEVNDPFKSLKRDRDRCIKLLKLENDRTGCTIFEGRTMDVLMQTSTKVVVDLDALKRDLGASYEKYLKSVPGREFVVIPKRA